jgi:DNA primase
MRFPPEFLDDIRTRVPVSDVVRRRVRLMKSGREWKGLSPFNSEKTPSFFVNDQKMAWFDFSSGKNGNIFDFVMQTEGLSFPEAVERLASEAGIALPVQTRDDVVQEKHRASLHDATAAAADYFETQLRGSGGARARAYLASRGLSAAMVAQFRLGFALPERYAMRDALAAKGIGVDLMCEAGLLIHGEGIAVPYDGFRDRLMFPITDRSGRTIAFGGRALTSEVQPKYRNSPETPLFHKGRVLFNHHAARKAAHDGAPVVAVEGYMDVIAMASMGFPAAVASLGTALTAEQCELMWTMAEEPILCFDGDGAGRKAAFRAAETALPLLQPGRSLRFALLPDGQDPDDIARTAGRETMVEILARAQPLGEILWIRETDGQALDTPERRAALDRRLHELAGTIRDETLRRYYAADFSNRLRALFTAARPTQDKGRAPFNPGRGGRDRGAPRPRGPLPPVSSSLSQSALFRPSRLALPAREVLILLILLNHPNLLEAHAEEVAALTFEGADCVTLRGHLLARLGDLSRGPAELRAALAQIGLAELIARFETLAPPSLNWILNPEAAAADAEAGLRQALSLHQRATRLHRELQSAERALATDASELNLARLKDIRDQLSALADIEASIEGFGTLSGRKTGAI